MKKAAKGLLRVGAALLAIVLLWLFLQFVLPHLFPTFRPDYPQVNLEPILAQEVLSQVDYQTLYAQTGLAPVAIDTLREMGEEGTAQILLTQERFFTPVSEAPCSPLGVTTREHRYMDETGALAFNVPLAPLRAGDILVTMSTHTAGWRHGHAGLVVDPDWGVTLESVVLGSLSDRMNAQHWRTYTTLLVLRPRADAETANQAARFALDRLDGIPYSLVSGAFGEKFQPVDSPHSAHCGYLPWYAWMSVGLDLDGDGGRVVAPMDFAQSPLMDVVQVYGFDPADYPIF